MYSTISNHDAGSPVLRKVIIAASFPVQISMSNTQTRGIIKFDQGDKSITDGLSSFDKLKWLRTKLHAETSSQVAGESGVRRLRFY